MYSLAIHPSFNQSIHFSIHPSFHLVKVIFPFFLSLSFLRLFLLCLNASFHPIFLSSNNPRSPPTFFLLLLKLPKQTGQLIMIQKNILPFHKWRNQFLWLNCRYFVLSVQMVVVDPTRTSYKLTWEFLLCAHFLWSFVLSWHILWYVKQLQKILSLRVDLHWRVFGYAR